MIPFQCPFCQQTIEVPDSRLGELEKCAACGNTCQITRPTGARFRAGGAASIAAARSARRAKSSRGTLVGLFVAGVVCLAIGLAMSTSSGSGRPTGQMIFLGVGALLLIVALAGVPGSIARQKRLPNADGLSVMGILGMVIPLIWLVALIMALAAAPQPARATAPARQPCPVCGESIPVSARKCRFCGAVL